jgi:hypothetical protein
MRVWLAGKLRLLAHRLSPTDVRTVRVQMDGETIVRAIKRYRRESGH